MIFAVSPLPKALSSFSFKVDGGGIKEDQVKASEQITTFPKDVFFDKVFGAPGRKGGCMHLVFCLFAKKGHSPIKMMQRQVLYAMYLVVSIPLFA
jgi:hypothetical protein